MPYGGVTLMMALVLWVISGVFVGLIFAVIMGTGTHGGFIGYIVFAIIGSVLSGMIYRLLGNIYTSSWQVDIMTGVVGALILMVIAQLSHHRERGPTHARRRNHHRRYPHGFFRF